jgi:N-acetylmuramoyl-L-alanine amidase|tara:strand:- start:154 stop:864 length:711 start_codon:yes stop_codon:yes gene_type:complete
MLKNIRKFYSPNFNKIKRKRNNIKYIIIHYTGMKREQDALKRLTKIQSEVSSHYFIKNNGTLLLLVPELYIAWHAGKSGWKNKKFLNKSSIGIEISNPGHRYGYKKFNKKQIQILINLLKKLINKFKISPKNILGHSDIAPERKKDPGEKFPWKTLARKKVSIWHKINPKILSKLRNQKCSKKDNISFVYNLKKIGYSKCPEKYLVKAFQMRFRPELINGKIDKECLEISKSIVKA